MQGSTKSYFLLMIQKDSYAVWLQVVYERVITSYYKSIGSHAMCQLSPISSSWRSR